MAGMRRGEVLGLRWRDLDLDRARLSVRQAFVAVGYEVVQSSPKNHHARVIDLDAETVAKLKAHRRRQSANEMSGAPTIRSTTSSWPRRTAGPSPARLQPSLRTPCCEGRPKGDSPS